MAGCLLIGATSDHQQLPLLCNAWLPHDCARYRLSDALGVLPFTKKVRSASSQPFLGQARMITALLVMRMSRCDYFGPPAIREASKLYLVQSKGFASTFQAVALYHDITEKRCILSLYEAAYQRVLPHLTAVTSRKTRRRLSCRSSLSDMRMIEQRSLFHT